MDALKIIERYKLFDVYSHKCNLTLEEAINRYTDETIPEEYREFCSQCIPGNERRCFCFQSKR